MRATAVLLVVLGALASCGPASSLCETDADCDGDVCARTNECLPRSSVTTLRITWTIGGQPASAATCSRSPDLYLLFFGFSEGDQFGYQPVPCEAGVFTIDKLPTRFTSVELGVLNRGGQEKPIGSSGTVSFDLLP